MQKKSLETILFSTIGVVIMAAILVGLNLITAPVHKRVDLTKEKVYTLSSGTRAILTKLDTPVKIRFYCTQPENASDYSVYMKTYAKKVEDLLAEYQQAGHGNLVIQKFDPQPNSEAEDSARLDGIEPQNLPGAGGVPFYLGLAVSQLDAKEAIPFLSPDRERELEYDISRAITRVVTPEKPVVGIMSSLPVFGAEANPMMQQMGQQAQPQWALITELQNDFTVKHVEMTASKIDDDIKLLVVIHPRDISDAAQFAIDQFIMRGGKLIAFLDASSQVDSRGQNPMMGQMPAGGSSLDKLLKAWGIEFDTAKVVADRNFTINVGGQDGDSSQNRPTWLALTPDAINSNDIATAELPNVWYFSGGAFTGTPVVGLTETVLFKSTTDSQLVDAMLANFSGENILKDFKPSGKEYALAVRLRGKFKSAFPDGAPEEKKDEAKDKTPEKKTDTSLKETKEDNTVVLVGDSDMIYDSFSVHRMNGPFGAVEVAMNGNLNFAQNLVEQLSGDNNLITVRSRAILQHPFTRLQKIEKQAEERSMEKEKELQDSFEKTEARLNELQQQKNPNQRYIESPEQKAEIENLSKTAAKIKTEQREFDKEKKREENALKHKMEAVNIAAMPLLVVLAGVGLAVFKSKRNSAQ